MAQLRAIRGRFAPRRRLSFIALILWSFVIAAAAGDSPDDDRWLSLPDLSWFAAVVLLASAVAGLVFILVLKPTFEPHKSHRPFRGFGSLVVVAAIGVAILLALDESVLLSPVEETMPGVAGESGLSEVDEQPEADDSLLDAIILGLGGLAAVALVAWNRRNDPESNDGSDHESRDRRLQAIEDASHILEDVSDPRRAVLLAYAALERELSAIGLHRHRVETPSEHLRRVLADRPALVEPATRLGELYLIARYSDLPIRPEDRDSARAALDRATTDLNVGTATR